MTREQSAAGTAKASSLCRNLTRSINFFFFMQVESFVGMTKVSTLTDSSVHESSVTPP